MPGSFRSRSKSLAVHCSFKASEGYLYPLEKGFVFVHKPPMHIRFDEVLSVGFDRVEKVRGEASRSFDLNVRGPLPWLSLSLSLSLSLFLYSYCVVFSFACLVIFKNFAD